MDDKCTQAGVPCADTPRVVTIAAPSPVPEQAEHLSGATAEEEPQTEQRAKSSFCHDKHNTSKARPLLFTIFWSLFSLVKPIIHPSP
jgi:hypothetical protein